MGVAYGPCVFERFPARSCVICWGIAASAGFEPTTVNTGPNEVLEFPWSTAGLVPGTVVTEDAAVPTPKPEPGTGSVAEQVVLMFAVVYHPLAPLGAGGAVHTKLGARLSQPTEVTWKEAQLA